jgi:FKBP-type peptidyl-prolyl cis-trans isomerase 2
MLLQALLFLSLFTTVLSSDDMEVRVDITKTNARGLPCTTAHKYGAMVTLSIEHADGSLTPSGWSTRKEAGGDGKPFEFTPGRGLIEGWTEGVLKMREGERALIHVPSSKGYGASPQGSKGGGWYIPGGSNLLFDLESAFWG